MQAQGARAHRMAWRPKGGAFSTTWPAGRQREGCALVRSVSQQAELPGPQQRLNPSPHGVAHHSASRPWRPGYPAGLLLGDNHDNAWEGRGRCRAH